MTLFAKKPKPAPPPPSEPVAKLIRLLQYDGEWTLDHCCLNHISGLRLWIANDQRFLHVREPFHLDFSPDDQALLWPHIKRLIDTKQKATLNQLSKLLDNA